MANTGNHRNRILKRLSQEEFDRLSSDLEPVTMSFKEPVYEQGKPVDYLYFPSTGIISLVKDLEEGSPVETGAIGREGMVGLPAILGRSPAAGRAFCQIPGEGLRIRPDAIQKEFDRGETLEKVLLRYTHAVMAMLAQNVACLGAHPLEARMCRWLLMTRDRMDSDEFPLTQEFLGQMLGVRRPTVSLAGSSLQRAGLIKYSRGRITILDRPGLEAASCECFAVVKEQFDKALDSEE